jgi:hypothetical protein
MTDIGDTIQAKSDQLNADDLLAGPIVVTITRVTVGKKTDDQPVVIYYENDGGRPYKPSKGMRRVLVHLWGAESATYVGRQLRLYRDPAVTFGKDAVGGIRIGAASNIDGRQRIMLQVKKGQKAGHEVDVLQAQQQPEATQADARQALLDATDLPGLERAWKARAMAPFREQLQAEMEQRKAALAPRDTAPQPEGGDYVGV